MLDRNITYQQGEGSYKALFNAMASPCELFIDTSDKEIAKRVGEAVAKEAWRIEDKFSRYQATSVVGQLNAKAGQKCYIDQETYLLLQFAQQCYELSEGLFDITSGILRRAWHFDCSDNIPSQETIDKYLPAIGFSKINYDESTFTMPANMEIDLGGLGKEYAVDKAIQVVQSITEIPVLVNFGGDLAATAPRINSQPWSIGIEHPSKSANKAVYVKIRQGALATSGDANRYLLKDGKRYSHVLNVKTGWPVDEAPNSITVAAPKCIQAGILATLALLQGNKAEEYLETNDITYWSIRD